ncbi:tryptophan--tRNA ligase [Patescibacteria group bacterium]|nr:tryptophan--tRNA ligase [Patescibacteria group bacterium]
MIDGKVLEYSNELKRLGINHEILEHPELVSVEDVQKYLGFGLDEALATLIMKTEKGFVALIKRGDSSLESKKVKKALGIESLRMATDEEFKKLTGVVPGAAHILHKVERTLIDERVFEKTKINGGSGSLLYTFRYEVQDLKKIPNSQVADITKISITTTSTSIGVKRVFSGIRATGRLHLGNYLGAVKGFLELEKTGEYETIYCVVDVHSITTPYDKNVLAKNKREIIIDYLAAGLDPKKSIIIYQSSVPEHIELAFYFSTVVNVARMLHLPTYKDKIKQHPHFVTMALLNYPVLMAADILIYKASLVPVGIDQEPHLEVTREIARKMNQIYGTDFPEPVRFATKGEYIPSLTGEGKMSKTVAGSFINLTDSLEEIRKKIRSVPTATTAGGEMSSGVKTLFTFAELFISKEVDKYKKAFEDGSLKFVELKDAIADAIYQELKPFQERRAKIAADTKYVDEVIRDGAERARKIARETVKEVKEKMGLT